MHKLSLERYVEVLMLKYDWERNHAPEPVREHFRKEDIYAEIYCSGVNPKHFASSTFEGEKALARMIGLRLVG